MYHIAQTGSQTVPTKLTTDTNTSYFRFSHEMYLVMSKGMQFDSDDDFNIAAQSTQRIGLAASEADSSRTTCTGCL